MKKRTKSMAVKLFFALFAVMPVVCFGIDASLAAGPAPYEFKGTKITSLTDILIAQENGYFAEAGIRFKDMGVIKAQESVTALMRGDIDFILMHPDRLAQARLSGLKIIAIGPGMIDHPKYPHLIYFVKKGSRIRTARDVIGKKIGIAFRGSCPDGILLDWLYQNGITRKQVEFVMLPETELEQALKQGLVDVIANHPSSYQAVMNHGGVTKLIDSYQIVKNPNGGTSFSIVVTEKWAKQHPDIAKGIVGAVIKAHFYIDSHLKIPEQDVTAFYYDDQKLITDARVQPWLDRLVKLGDLKPGQIKAAELYTNIYNPYYRK
jgi:ABC-type nitrate/sulfonate/bicarbonate transport system substrate-binding protein